MIRSINRVSWCPYGDKVALAFCNTEYLAYYDKKIDTRSLIYDVNNPLCPLLYVSPHSPLMSLEYNNREPCILAGGTNSGDLIMLDTRTGGTPVSCVEVPDNKGDPVTDLSWMNIRYQIMV